MLFKPEFTAPHVVSVIASLLVLLAAFRAASLARVLFALLFAGACAVNWITALETPNVYLEYAPLAVFKVYRDIILGPFEQHITLFVGAIATCQGLIALGVLLGDVWARLALASGIVFLVDITPLGVGAAFPSTLIMGAAAGVLLTRSRRAVLAKPMWSILQDAGNGRSGWLLRMRSRVQ